MTVLMRVRPQAPIGPGGSWVETPVYLSDAGWVSGSGETDPMCPPDTAWLPLLSDTTLRRAMWQGRRAGGRAGTDPGSAVIRDPLPAWGGWRWVGAPYERWFLPTPAPDFGSWRRLDRGYVERATLGAPLRLVLGSLALLLDRRTAGPAPFAGTGDLEGPPEYAGRRKPWGWGAQIHVAPVLIDEVHSIYAVGEPGTVTMAGNVGDGGRLFGVGRSAGDAPDLASLRAASWNNGPTQLYDYATCNALGLVRYARRPAKPPHVAASFRQPAGPGDALRHAALACGLTEADLDAAALAAVASPQLTWWTDGTGSAPTWAQWLDTLLSGGGWWWGGDDWGLTLGAADAPAVPVGELTADELCVEGGRPAVEWLDTEAPIGTLRLGGGRRFVTFTDFYEGAASRWLFEGDGLSWRDFTGSTSLAGRPESQEVATGDFALNGVGGRLLRAWGGDDTRYVRWTCPWRDDVALGQTWRLTYAPIGLDRAMVIEQLQPDLRRGRLTLTCRG